MARFAPGTDFSLYEPESLRDGPPKKKVPKGEKLRGRHGKGTMEKFIDPQNETKGSSIVEPLRKPIFEVPDNPSFTPRPIMDYEERATVQPIRFEPAESAEIPAKDILKRIDKSDIKDKDKIELFQKYLYEKSREEAVPVSGFMRGPKKPTKPEERSYQYMGVNDEQKEGLQNMVGDFRDVFRKAMESYQKKYQQ